MSTDKIFSENLIDSYLTGNGHKKTIYFDELVAPDGSVYPHWQKIVDRYNSFGKEILDIKEKEVLNQLKENGVTYNIYGDPNGLNRPWMLDPVPMVFSEEDWKMIEKGLIEEVSLILKSQIDSNCTSMQAIGYKEVVKYLDGYCTYDEMIRILKMNTRNYAKRQITWFKRYKEAQFIDTSKFENSNEITRFIISCL